MDTRVYETGLDLHRAVLRAEVLSFGNPEPVIVLMLNSGAAYLYGEERSFPTAKEHFIVARFIDGERA